MAYLTLGQEGEWENLWSAEPYRSLELDTATFLKVVKAATPAGLTGG